MMHLHSLEMVPQVGFKKKFPPTRFSKYKKATLYKASVVTLRLYLSCVVSLSDEFTSMT